MGRPTTKQILICVGLFLFFLIIRFPVSSLKSYLISMINANAKQAGVTVLSAENVYISLLGWPGIAFTNTDLTMPDYFSGGEIDTGAKKIVARVGIGSLFPPSLSYSISIEGLRKGGDLYLKVHSLKPSLQAVQRGVVYASLDNLNIAQFTLEGSRLSGVVSGEIQTSFDSTDLSKNTGNINLTVKNLTTPGGNPQGFPIPPIKFGDVEIKTVMKNGVAEIGAFKFGSPTSDLRGDIGGEVKIGNTLNQSALNISMKIQVSDSFSTSSDGATFVTILNNFDKRNPGKSYNLRWNKTLERIAYNFLDNGPVEAPERE